MAMRQEVLHCISKVQILVLTSLLVGAATHGRARRPRIALEQLMGRARCPRVRDGVPLLPLTSV